MADEKGMPSAGPALAPTFWGRFFYGFRGEFAMEKFKMQLTEAEMRKFGRSAFFDDSPWIFLVFHARLLSL